MSPDTAADKPKSDLSKYPWASLLVVFFSIVGGLAVIFDNDDLSFDEYLTVSLAAAAALSIGRGLAYKKSDGIEESPLSRKLNSIPWATVLVGVFSLVGAVVVLLGDDGTLAFDEYLTRVLAAAAVLGIGRGIAVYKDDHDLINTRPVDPTSDEFDDVPPELAEPPSVSAGTPGDPPLPPVDRPHGAVEGKAGERS